MMARRILHVDMDAFFVSVEQVLRPELRGKPVVVGGKPDRRGVVAAASYEARAYGLHSGIPLVTASRLCPQAIFIEGDFKRYRDASRRFMAILADFSPHLEPAGLDEAYLDVTGFESLHGSIKQMAAAIKKRIKDELGLCASIGIAGGKVVAKVASDRSKPDGLLEVPEGGDRAFLAPLPVSDLPGVGKRGQLVLKEMGVATIGQLAALPVATLKERFGSYGVTLHNHANGLDDSRVTAPGEAKSISRETTFGEDVRDEALLMATLRYLGERVGGSLRNQGKRARCVSLKLRYADFTTITRQQTLPHPQDADQAIFAAGSQLLTKELAGGNQAVRLIGIGVSRLTPGRQLDMFATAELRLERLNKAIDRIREKYGFRAIQTGRTLRLRDVFPGDGKDYTLATPSLSR